MSFFISDGSMFNGGEMQTNVVGTGTTSDGLVSPGQMSGGTIPIPVVTDLLIDLGPGDHQYTSGTHIVQRPRPTPKKAQSCQYSPLSVILIP